MLKYEQSEQGGSLMWFIYINYSTREHKWIMQSQQNKAYYLVKIMHSC